MLLARDISKRFGGVTALREVSLTLRAGEIRCLAGENGSGKSTLIKILAGVHAPDAGTIVLDGAVHRRLRPIEAIRAGIQVIHQDFSIFPNLTVAENIALATQLEHRRFWVKWPDMRRLAQDALEQLGATLDFYEPVENLSVAGKQLVSIARALVQGTRLLVMDEPTTALTRREIDLLFRTVQRLQARGVSVLFVSHKLNEVLELSQQITVLRNGEKVVEGPVTQFDARQLTRHMTGMDVPPVRLRVVPETPGPSSVLRVEELSRQGRFHNITFSVPPGQIVGLGGLLGSGRTDLALALFGMAPADQGVICLNDRPVQCRSVPEAIRHGIAYLPEDRLTEGLFMKHSIARNLAVTVLDRLRTRLGLLDFGRLGALCHQWMEQLRIKADSREALVETLSGGNQQKVVLAKWLATQARLLILNGPTVGVDVGSKAAIHQVIQDLARQGLAILLISDDLPELLQNCHRLLLMHQGRLIEDRPATAWDEATLTTRLNDLP